MNNERALALELAVKWADQRERTGTHPGTKVITDVATDFYQFLVTGEIASGRDRQ